MLSLKQMLDATLVKPVIVSDYSSQVLLKPDNEYQEEVDLAIE